MKESITKFDLEAAFKALDDIDMPIAEKGINANKPALTEIFSRKSKFDSLFEEYYDISSSEELGDAKEAREAEVAKAKLARIEKIVDLDAESPDDILTSYVGKYIIQCPQCMTLFYKNPEDVEESEDDPETVNVNEVCQHCGNESGYSLIGKVGEATEEEAVANSTDLEPSEEEEFATEDEVTEDEETSSEVSAEEGEEDFDLDSGLEELDLEIEDDETEANESLQNEPANTTSLTEDLTEDTEVETSAEDFEKLINSPEFKKPISDGEARAMINEFSENEEEVKEDLTEGSLSDLGKAISKKIKQSGKNIKDKFSAAVDKATDNIKTREEKADWVLENALEDYSKTKADTAGKLVPDEKNQKFQTFVVTGFIDKYENGKEITKAPSFNNKDLVLGKNGVQEKTSYKDADNIAKGWSMTQGNGPAFIYLAKDKDDDKAVFLCEYFKGKLENDQLEKYFEVVKNHLKGAELMAQGGMTTENEEETTESLNTIMNNLEELQEASLERLISDSLVETYKNVAGFRLADCSYLNEKFSVNGTVYFTSGNTRQFTYNFFEAYINKNGKIELKGLNEKLGLDTQVNLIGHTDKSGKTFIAESFKCIK